MGQSLVKNYLHIVFSTKNRYPWITPSIEESLYQYLGGICRRFESPAIQIGGYRDHVHILCSLSKNMGLATLIKEVKSNSSKWIKTKGEEYSKFYWQNGYGAFSVYSTQVDPLIRYIINQEIHHQRNSFQQEYIHFLNDHQMEFDERYIWD